MLGLAKGVVLWYDVLIPSRKEVGGMKIAKCYIARAYKAAKIVKVVLDVVKTLRDLFA